MALDCVNKEGRSQLLSERKKVGLLGPGEEEKGHSKGGILDRLWNENDTQSCNALGQLKPAASMGRG